MKKYELIMALEEIIALNSDEYSDGEILDKIIELINKEKL